MAGEFTGYYTYDAAGSNRRLKGMYGTQDAADTAGGLDSSVTANQGSTEFPNGIADWMALGRGEQRVATGKPPPT